LEVGVFVHTALPLVHTCEWHTCVWHIAFPFVHTVCVAPFVHTYPWQANLPSSLFTVLATTTDIDVTHTSMKKLFLTVKTNAKSYYLNYARSFKKRVRALGNSPKKVNSVTGIVSDDPRVLSAAVRYCWKVGMFYEVIGGGKSGVYYQEAYGYLVQLYNVLMKGRGENVRASIIHEQIGLSGALWRSSFANGAFWHPSLTSKPAASPPPLFAPCCSVWRVLAFAHTAFFAFFAGIEQPRGAVSRRGGVH